MHVVVGRCLELGKCRIEIYKTDCDTWEYRIIDQYKHFRNAGICPTESECRIRVRDLARQLLPAKLLTDRYWGAQNWRATVTVQDIFSN